MNHWEWWKRENNKRKQKEKCYTKKLRIFKINNNNKKKNSIEFVSSFFLVENHVDDDEQQKCSIIAVFIKRLRGVYLVEMIEIKKDHLYCFHFQLVYKKKFIIFEIYKKYFNGNLLKFDI